MGSLPGNGKQPPIAPRSYLQSITSPSILASPTGPGSAGPSPNENFATDSIDASSSLNLHGTLGDFSSDSPATLHLRPRPTRWKVLCKNTILDNQSYPLPSSHPIVPQLCVRRSDCLYGHHGDLYTDVSEAGKLQDEIAIQDIPGRSSNCTEHGPIHNNRQLPSITEPNFNRKIHIRPVEPWVERRAEWRKRQAALGPHADTTVNSPRWEENYKNKDVKRRPSEIGKGAFQRGADRRILAGTIEDNKHGQYSSHRAQDKPYNGNHWQWDLGHQNAVHHGQEKQEKQDPVAFENGLRKLSIDGRQEPQFESASKARESQSKSKSETGEDDGDSTSSGETASTVQFIIPPFQKGLKKFQNTSAQTPAKVTGKSASDLFNAAPSTVSSGLDASISEFRPTYMPNVQPPPHVQHASVSPLSHQLPKGMFLPQPSLPSASSTSGLPKPNIPSNPPHISGQWDMYRHNYTSRGQSLPHQVPVWMTLENFRYCMEQGRPRAPPGVEWKPYAVNAPQADCTQKQAVHASRQVQTAVNTFTVQSPSHTSSQNAPPAPPQRHLDHAWNQVKMLISLYPDCLNKRQAIQTLQDLIVPYSTDDLDMKNVCSTPESLQTSLHRLALSISEQEHELAAEFQAEIWAVLGWLGGGGGNVALLKKMEENRMESRDHLEGVLNSGKDGISDMKNGGILISSGQITLQGADEKGQGFNGVVALAPGQPAILSPVFPRGSIKTSERDIPAALSSNPPILSIKSSSISGVEAGSHKQVPPRLPTASENDFVPPRLSTSPLSIAGQQEEPYPKDVMDFFLNEKMEIYLQDSYDKVLRVQTAISLKWRRVSKVFEREWCSGISRFARNGLVLRAFWNVRAIEERDWLSPENFLECMNTGQGPEGGSRLSQFSHGTEPTKFSVIEKPCARQENSRQSPLMKMRNSFMPNTQTEWEGRCESPHKGTGKEFDKNSQVLGLDVGMNKQPQAALGSIPQIPQRAVWDRRGLCQEVEPFALSNEGRHFLELVEKMCLKKVMEYADTNQVGKPFEYLQKLPTPPDAKFFKGQNYRANLATAMGGMTQNQISASEKGSCTSSYDLGENWAQYKLTDHKQTWIPEEKKRSYSTEESKLCRGSQECSVGEENFLRRPMSLPVFRAAFELSEDDIQTLIMRLHLEPRLIESPVLNAIFSKSGPLYYTGKPPSDDTLNHGLEGKVRARFLEMCHLDRSLFMGYIVLEILSIWEEQRKEATRVRWRFPEIDREIWVAQKLKRVEEERAMLLALKEKMALQDKMPENAPVPPLALNWADVARGKFRVEEKKPSIASPMTSQIVTGQNTGKERQIVATSIQPSQPKIPIKENPPSMIVPLAKAYAINPTKQADSSFMIRKQADVTTMAQHTLPTPEMSKFRTPGCGLLYTEVLKGKTSHKLDQTSSQTPETFQSINTPTSIPSVPTVASPLYEVVKSASELDANNNIDDSLVWKKYKPKKEKKRHGFDLDDSIEYQKGEIVKISPPPAIASNSILKVHQKVEPPPSSHPLPILITAPIIHNSTENKNTQPEETPVQLTPPMESPKPLAIQELEAEIDREIEAEKRGIRTWLNNLQTWLWTFNEGAGVNFFEIADILDWETGFHGASTTSDEGASAAEGIRKPHTHRGGVKNKHVLWKKEVAEREMRGWEMKERERVMKEWAMREHDMREREIWEREKREWEMMRRLGTREQEIRRREMGGRELRKRWEKGAAGWAWETERGRPSWTGDSWVLRHQGSQ